MSELEFGQRCSWIRNRPYVCGYGLAGLSSHAMSFRIDSRLGVEAHDGWGSPP